MILNLRQISETIFEDLALDFFKQPDCTILVAKRNSSAVLYSHPSATTSPISGHQFHRGVQSSHVGENKRNFATRKRQLTKTKGKKESQRQKVFCPNPRLVSPFLGIRSSLVALICMPTHLALQLNDCKGRVQKPESRNLSARGVPPSPPPLNGREKVASHKRCSTPMMQHTKDSPY